MVSHGPMVSHINRKHPGALKRPQRPSLPGHPRTQGHLSTRRHLVTQSDGNPGSIQQLSCLTASDSSDPKNPHSFARQQPVSLKMWSPTFFTLPKLRWHNWHNVISCSYHVIIMQFNIMQYHNLIPCIYCIYILYNIITPEALVSSHQFIKDSERLAQHASLQPLFWPPPRSKAWIGITALYKRRSYKFTSTDVYRVYRQWDGSEALKHAKTNCRNKAQQHQKSPVSP